MGVLRSTSICIHIARVTVMPRMHFAVVATSTRFLRRLVMPAVTPQVTICRLILMIRLH